MSEPRTLLELCVARAGGGWRDIARGSQVCTFIAEWAIASWTVGEPLDMAGFCDWWKFKRGSSRERKAYRRFDQFRDLFPDQETPQAIVDRLQRPAKVPKDASAILTVPVIGVSV